MKFYRIAFTLTAFFLLTPTYANQCPTADEVRHCHGNECSFQRISGWSTQVFYTDQGKPFSFQKMRVENMGRGKKISCFYTYINPDDNHMMPPALVLRTMIE